MSTCGCCDGGAGTGGCCCASPDTNYLVTFPGVAAGTSTGCDLLTAEFCLCYAACNWYRSVGLPFEDYDPITHSCVKTFNGIQVELEFNCTDSSVGTGTGTGTATEPGVVWVRVYGFCSALGGVFGARRLIATYERSRSSWHCGGTNTLVFSSSSGDCTNWPATITVTPNSTGTTCKCRCDAGFGYYTYELRMGALLPGSSQTAGTGGTPCVAGDCGCDAPFTRICMSYGGGCGWSGGWEPIAGLADAEASGLYDLQALAQSTFGGAYGYKPAGCSVAWFGSVATAAKMYYEDTSQNMVVGWGPVLGGTWSAKYVLAASSFDRTGNNTFTFDSGSYDACVLPSTLEVNFYSVNNADCIDVFFRCDVCAGASLSGGWTFTISGVSGPDHSVPCDAHSSVSAKPCESINGTYCMGLGGSPVYAECYWRTLNGYGPDFVNYPTCSGATANYKAQSYADMAIIGGVVYVQIRTVYIWATTNCPKILTYEIGVADFNCNGDNVLTLKCSEALTPIGLSGGTDPGDGSCDCTGIPSTITISPTTECGPAPIDYCCTSPDTKTPRVRLSGMSVGSCLDCECVPGLEICLDYSAETAGGCSWSKSFSISTDAIPACVSSANLCTLTYTSGDNYYYLKFFAGASLLATYRLTASSFSCGGLNTFTISGATGDVCNWPTTATVDMSGVTCTDCGPCSGTSVNGFDIFLNFDGTDYEFSVCGFDCTLTSEEQAANSFGNAIYVVLEIGQGVSRYLRLLVYYDFAGTGTEFGTGAGGGGTFLIGVYNLLGDVTTAACGSASLDLATGNVNECGWEVDEVGYTELLSSTAVLTQYSGCGCVPRTYDVPGTFLYPTISGAAYVFEAWGAGGGGKGSILGNRNGGGGGGGYSKTTWVSDGSTLSITIGNGGSGGGWGGEDGGDTSVGTVCIAKGGTGANGSNGGLGGAASSGTGDTKYSGGDGGVGGAGDPGGGGGGSATSSSNGSPGADGDAGGAGGTGEGAGGDGGILGNGASGNAPGGGGGGGDNGAGGLGGRGANGRVIISCA